MKWRRLFSNTITLTSIAFCESYAKVWVHPMGERVRSHTHPSHTQKFRLLTLVSIVRCVSSPRNPLYVRLLDPSLLPFRFHCTDTHTYLFPLDLSNNTTWREERWTGEDNEGVSRRLPCISHRWLQNALWLCPAEGPTNLVATIFLRGHVFFMRHIFYMWHVVFLCVTYNRACILVSIRWEIFKKVPR